MPDFASILSGLSDLVLVVLGFTLIVVIHEFGHFIAARWAGVRVLAFAVGFGPAIVSFRKGLGWRKGSSASEYDARAKSGVLTPGTSPTEYRLNFLPLGGYVKMLGQDDADPSARSDAPDSFQNCAVWKRMIIISAGVVFNIISAALLFMLVFSVGLKTEAPRIGEVASGKPAAIAVALNAHELGVTTPGLQPGDEVLTVNGEQTNSFNDFQSAVVMSKAGDPFRVEVRRAGVAAPLRFELNPTMNPQTRFLEVGAGPLASVRLGKAGSNRDAQALRETYAKLNLTGVRPGMLLESVNTIPATSAHDLTAQARSGQPQHLTFADPTSQERVSVTLPAMPVLDRVSTMVDAGQPRDMPHILGFVPVLAVKSLVPEKDTPATKIGLKGGDVFVQLGDVEYPSAAAGIREIRQHKGLPIRVVVARKNADNTLQELDLGSTKVNPDGTLGFETDPDSSPLFARWPASLISGSDAPSGSRIGLPPGARIDRINDRSITSISDLRQAVLAEAAANEHRPLELKLTYTLPLSKSPTEPHTKLLSISATEITHLADLGFASTLPLFLFEPEQTVLKASSPLAAVAMGTKETRRVMLSVYATFLRLFQGSVKVEHLKGPVGIAHVGVMIADRGFVWLLFFMALISVNLAVVNFLPLPIVDGGHMIFLIYEQFTGRPPPVSVQNGAAIVGLVLIAGVFLFVTFNDVVGVVSSLSAFFKS